MANQREILGTLLPGFVGTELPEWLRSLLADGLGGVCLFGVNVDTLEQVAALTAEIHAANPDAIIAIDEEGGDVTRLHHRSGAPYPGNALLGRIDDEVKTEAVAGQVGGLLRRVGVDLDFAPDVDVNSNPDNPVIGVRSFGVDPAAVGRHSAAWVRGLQKTGVAASIKHFPGHGDTAQDSHLALPVVARTRDELLDRELVPFRAAIEAGTATVMTSHILLPLIDPEGPATFSSTVLQGILRGELGFDGVIVTDALDMKGASGEIGIPEAAVRALAAGSDLLCLGTENTAEELEAIVAVVSAAVDDGWIRAGWRTRQPASLAWPAISVGPRKVFLFRNMSPSPSRSWTSCGRSICAPVSPADWPPAPTTEPCSCASARRPTWRWARRRGGRSRPDTPGR